MRRSASAEPSVAVSRPGDLWLLGEHRILCGNALRRRLLPGSAGWRDRGDGDP